MIEVVNVSAGYPGRPVLHDVSFAFPPGQITGILGKNGSGKTTLLKAASGLLRPESGQVLLCGRPIGSYAPRERAKKISVLPQSRETPAVTVRGLVTHGRFPHLSFPRRLSGRDEEIVQAVMRETGVDAYADRLLSRLSGGERQKAYIAMALAQQTDFIFLDEPTASLDIRHQYEALDEIRRLVQDGKTIAVILHDLSQAMALCDTLCVMDEGRIAAQGAADDVYQSGALERVFGVRSHCFQTEQGQKHYVFHI